MTAVTAKPPGIGRIVWYHTDGRNGLSYDLPAMINCTQSTHPGDYVIHQEECLSFSGEDCNCTPESKTNPLIVPETEMHCHLTVFTPGGFGTTVTPEGTTSQSEHPEFKEFVGGRRMHPGSGSYVELDVPYDPAGGLRTWRWPVIS